MLYSLIKPIFFSMDPEWIHHFVISLAKSAPHLGKLWGINHNKNLEVKIGSTKWTFPLGLAAGLDKNAEALDFFDLQGFGAIECGTLTLKPQFGNPKPRLIRYPEQKSLRNSMGFPNLGLSYALGNLKKYQGKAPLGINLGKNKDSSPTESIQELCHLFESLKNYGDYFVINVSSPNTPGLRALQESTYLKELFGEINKIRNKEDLYLKISPDLSSQKIFELSQICAEMKLTGIIATNTTIISKLGEGGVSGRLLKEKSKNIRKVILSENFPLELIAVGGIESTQDLFDFWYEGGKVAQVYTSYIYQGPKLLRDFNKKLEKFTQTQNLSLDDFFSLNLDERRYRLRQLNLNFS